MHVTVILSCNLLIFYGPLWLKAVDRDLFGTGVEV